MRKVKFIHLRVIKTPLLLIRMRTIPTEWPPLVGEVVPTIADRGCRVVSATDPTFIKIGFLDRNCYFSVQVAAQLSSRG
jgi:hypothetical protein